MVIAQVAPGMPRDRLLHLLGNAAPDLCALPEYSTVRSGERSQSETVSHFGDDLQMLGDLARELDTVLAAGTVVEPASAGVFNTAPLFDRGLLRGVYRKVHPTEREQLNGVVPGEGYRVLAAGGVRVGTLICADVLHPDSFARLGEGKPDIVVVPTTSPLRPGEPLTEKERRDQEIFVAGARRAGAFVVKACACGSVYGGPLQGRSLIAAPWGEVLARVPPEREREELLLTADLDLDRLWEWRRHA